MTNALHPQPGINRLTEAWRFCSMLENFDLGASAVIRNRVLISIMLDFCEKATQQYNGESYIWANCYPYVFAEDTAVHIGLILKEKGLMAIPCYMPEADSSNDRPTMFRICKLDRIPTQQDLRLQIFRPCKEWTRWW